MTRRDKEAMEKPWITTIALIIFTGLFYLISIIQALKFKEMVDKNCKQYQIQILRPLFDPPLTCIEY